MAEIRQLKMVQRSIFPLEIHDAVQYLPAISTNAYGERN
jgi:hypothetical protein